MDNYLLQSSNWRALQKYLLPEGHYDRRQRLQFGTQNQDVRNFNEGFFTIEMLIWISIILLLLVAFLSIHRVYITEHNELQKEYQNEWSKLNAKRRNKKI